MVRIPSLPRRLADPINQGPLRAWRGAGWSWGRSFGGDPFAVGCGRLLASKANLSLSET